MIQQPQTPRCLLRRSEVRRRTGLSDSTLYELMSAGKFPRPVPLGGGRAVAWLEEEVNDWIDSRIAAREQAQFASA